MASGGKFDFKEVEKLQKQIERLEEERDAFCEECARYLAARLLTKVIKRTPVGRAPKLKKNGTVKVKGANGKTRTFLSKETAIWKQYWSGYQGGTLRKNWTVGDVRYEGNQYIIEVINPTEYASYVEYGHRQKPGRYVPALGVSLKGAWVSGKFMLTISERELQTQAPKMIKKRLADWLKGVFNV